MSVAVSLRPSVSVSIQQTGQNAGSLSLTNVKIKKVIASVLGAAAAGAGSAIAFTATSLSTIFFISVPLIAASGILFWYADHLIDYDDPDTILKIREQSLGKPLSELIRKHSVERIFAYEILDRDSFMESYRLLANTLSFKEILSLYHRMQGSLIASGKKELFTIPSPSEWKELFFKETETLRCDAIVYNYPLDVLSDFQILSSQQAEILKQTRKENEIFTGKKIELGKEFLDLTKEDQVRLNKAKMEANFLYDINPCKQLIQQIDEEKESAIRQRLDAARMQSLQEANAFAEFKSQLAAFRAPDPLTKEDERKIRLRERQMNLAISGIYNREHVHRIEIENAARWKKMPLETALEYAKMLRKYAVKQAKETFDRDTLPIRQKIDARQDQNQKEYEEKISALTLEYRSL